MVGYIPLNSVTSMTIVLCCLEGFRILALQRLVFLKLGGSLITEKARTATPRIDVLNRLAGEIAQAIQIQPDLSLILGHGSGSFGHVPAKEYGTRQGVYTQREWRGFATVWQQASTLNRLVMHALQEVGLQVMSFPPSAMVLARSGEILRWDTSNLQRALDAKLIPVVFGDVAFDQVMGGTILSTEDLFDHLAPILKPQRILLAGIEPGVWEDYPECTQIIPEVFSANIDYVRNSLCGATATDVTGGMASKVLQSLDLCQRIPGMQVAIFSGETPGLVTAALQGALPGTRIHA